MNREGCSTVSLEFLDIGRCLDGEALEKAMRQEFRVAAKGASTAAFIRLTSSSMVIGDTLDGVTQEYEFPLSNIRKVLCGKQKDRLLVLAVRWRPSTDVRLVGFRFTLEEGFTRVVERLRKPTPQTYNGTIGRYKPRYVKQKHVEDGGATTDCSFTFDSGYFVERSHSIISSEYRYMRKEFGAI